MTRWSVLKCGNCDLRQISVNPSLSMDCRIKSGNDDIEIRSRGAWHPSLASNSTKICLQTKREAERRQAHPFMSAPHSLTLPPENARARSRATLPDVAT